MNALLVLTILATAATSAPANRERSREDVLAKMDKRLADVLAETSKHLVVDRTYAPGARVELALGVDEGARLRFTKNAAGVSEFLFRYKAGCVDVLYACAGERHDWTILTNKRTADSRTISKGGAPVWMKCATAFELRDGTACITFLATPVSEKEVQAIREEQKRHDQERLRRLRRTLEWDEGETVDRIRMVMPTCDDPDLATLRTKYDLEKVVAGAGDDYERLRRLVKWVHDRWQHTGNNTPSKPDPLTILAEAAAGKRFRCVEYATVIVGCAQALGMPARQLGLKREDVETAQSDAGHVVAEIWLASRNKWVLADGQWDAIPEKDGVPLNAVEFQDAFARSSSGLKIRSSSDIDPDRYLRWVAPYLYYFDFAVDQRLFTSRADQRKDQQSEPRHAGIMLVPKGAKKPTVFQRNSPMKNLTYLSNPKAFYPVPTTTNAK